MKSNDIELPVKGSKRHLSFCRIQAMACTNHRGCRGCSRVRRNLASRRNSRLLTHRPHTLLPHSPSPLDQDSATIIIEFLVYPLLLSVHRQRRIIEPLRGLRWEPLHSRLNVACPLGVVGTSDVGNLQPNVMVIQRSQQVAADEPFPLN